MSIICPRCESENPPELLYCDFCGYELRSELETVAETPAVHNEVDTELDPEPIVEKAPLTEAELWVELGTFLNTYDAEFDTDDVQDIEMTKRALRGRTSLDLSCRELSALPQGIGFLTQLESIDLSDNALSTLPNCLRSLTRVHNLELWENKLQTLPDWIVEFTDLTVLDLSDNKF